MSFTAGGCPPNNGMPEQVNAGELTIGIRWFAVVSAFVEPRAWCRRKSVAGVSRRPSSPGPSMLVRP